MALTETAMQLVPTSAVGFSILLSLLVIVLYWSSAHHNGRTLPPGPRPKPIIGNLLDMPNAETAQAYYTSLGQQYGPISSLSVFGTTLIIINDHKIARELLDKRAGIYSDRPVMQMLGELLGMRQSILLEHHNDRFTRMRKIAHGQLGSPSAILRWRDDIDVEIRRYLLRTLRRPAEFEDHLRLEAAAVILKVLYGYEMDQHAPDPIVEHSKLFTAAVIRTGVPGEYLVDAMPLLKYVPAWFPGAAWKRQALAWGKIVEDFAWVPFNYAKRQVAQGTAPHSAVSEPLMAKTQRHSDDDIAWAAASMFGGGADTTQAAMEDFFLAMTLNPEVMERAQQEIDKVVGLERLVNENDRIDLPYTDALFKEVMRWEPLLDVNMPHCASADDSYNGYFIPKGSLILSNMTGYMHSRENYNEPERFKPERFLGEAAEMSPFELIWGNGRRICPGRHLAFFTLWMSISRTLQVFDIRAKPGKTPRRKFTWGVIRRPFPFENTIKVRSPKHEALIVSVEQEHPAPAHGSKL